MMTGELLALLSATCFAASGVTIARGAGAKGQDNGAFLSILLTTALAAAAWVYGGLRSGWPRLHPVGMLWFAGAGVLTIFIGRVFLYASVQRLGAVRASAVKRLNPLFSVLLGVLVLGEALDISLIVGMLLIFASFGVLVKQSLSGAAAGADTGAAGAVRSWSAQLANLGFLYGPVSALAYACGYVARKQGLELMPDPAFGTLLGSVVGAVLFVLAARFVDSYRHAARNTLTSFNPWLLAAGILNSAGQLLYFAALNHSTISRVALISSMEVFVTMFLTAVLFRSREPLNEPLNEPLSGPVLLAAAMGVAGTAFVVLRAA